MAGLDLALLIIYALLFLATTVIFILYGFQRLAWVGWGYLAVFCGLKIASNALQMIHTGTAAAVLICSIALVFLTLAVAFVLRTALSYACHPGARAPRHTTFDCILSVAFHLLAGIAMVFLATGAWELATRPPHLSDPARPHRGESHAGAGAMVLMLSIILICAVAVLGYKDLRRPGCGGHHHHHHQQQQGPLKPGPSRRGRLGRRLILAAAAAGFCLAVRVAAGMYWFFGRGPEANPVTGTLARRLAMGTLPELLAVLALVVGGAVAWDIAW